MNEGRKFFSTFEVEAGRSFLIIKDVFLKKIIVFFLQKYPFVTYIFFHQRNIQLLFQYFLKGPE